MTQETMKSKKVQVAEWAMKSGLWTKETADGFMKNADESVVDFYFDAMNRCAGANFKNKSFQ
jgi:hypothetical protein